MDDYAFTLMSDDYQPDYINEKPYIPNEEEENFISETEHEYNSIVAQYSVETGKQISLAERNRLGYLQNGIYNYGEILFRSLAEIFTTIKARHGIIQPQGIFYDLGCGTGKVVIAAALLHDFSECHGIEILEPLYQASLDLKQKVPFNRPNIIFHNTSYFDYDFSDADLFFINSTCCSQDDLFRIGSIPVKQGCFAITTTSPLRNEQWKVLEVVRKQMSWDPAQVFIHQRIG